MKLRNSQLPKSVLQGNQLVTGKTAKKVPLYVCRFAVLDGAARTARIGKPPAVLPLSTEIPRVRNDVGVTWMEHRP
jgi:hypothetical protein